MFPKLRFKEFDGDWLKLKYKDVLTIKYGKDHKSLNDGDIPVYGTGGLMRHVNKYLYDGESILIGRKGTIDKPKYIEGIAFSNVYLGVSNDITYDGHLIKLSPDLNIIEPKFLNYCLKVAYVRKQLIQGGKTATMTTIGQQEVGNTLVKIPCLEEQIRIANFLSAIDQKIDVVSKQIEQAKQWKKGLLQQMFI